MEKSQAKKIAYYGVMSALVFILLTLETFVFIYFIQPSPAFLTIPFAIALCLRGSKGDMFVGGTILGFCSFFLSFIVGYAAFYNPLISILPRIMIGVVAVGVYRLFSLLFQNAKSSFIKDVLPLSFAGFFGVLTNTVLVLIMLFIFDFSGISAVFATIMSLNFTIEAISGIVLTPIFVLTIRKVSKV